MSAFKPKFETLQQMSDWFAFREEELTNEDFGLAYNLAGRNPVSWNRGLKKFVAKAVKGFLPIELLSRPALWRLSYGR